MNPEKKFELLDKLNELTSAINCLSLDPESMTNSNVKSKIEALVSDIKSGIFETKEESLNNQNSQTNQLNQSTNQNKITKKEKETKSNANRKKIFADGATGFAMRITTFNNKYAITTHEKGEINLWDIEFYTHLDRNCTTLKGNVFSLVKLHEKAMKFATCDFVQDGSLVFWSITQKGTICVENIFHVNFKTRNMSFLKTDNQSLLLLARTDNKIDIWNVKCDFNYSYAEYKMTVDLENPIACLNYIHYIPVKSELNNNENKMIKDEDDDLDIPVEVYNETYILGGGKNGELIHINYSSKEGLFDKHIQASEGGTYIAFKYQSGEKDQIEVILPLSNEDRMFLTGSLGAVVQLFRIGQTTPVKKVYTFPDVVTSMWYKSEENNLAIGSTSVFLFDVIKKEKDNVKEADYDFSLNEVVDSGFVVDDFAVKYEENIKRSTFIWVNMDSRLLRIITPKYIMN